MNKYLFLLSPVLLLLANPLVTYAQPLTPISYLDHPKKVSKHLSSVQIKAQKFVELLAKEDFVSAVQNFDSTMKQTLSPEKLQEFWQSLIAQSGSFKRQVSVQVTKSQQYDVAIVTCEFEKANFNVKVVFNNDKQISGLHFMQTPPRYAHLNSFREQAVKIGIGYRTLPGTLTLPVGKGSFPVIVLVHGSGAGDRDESISFNKPFRDLAWGLASQGIAVLRYDKRSNVYPAQFINTAYTVKEETIDDALAAVSLLRKTPGINKNKIFVLGHSLGGTLIPRIGKQDLNIAGLIVMAGFTRPFEDIILEQFSYLFSLNGNLLDSQKAELEELKRQVARVKDPNLSTTDKTDKLPLGVPALYWLDLRGYNPPEVAKELKQPMLILQGERDYQVTMEDFQGWQNVLSVRPKVVFKSYPKLNHLFFEGEGKSIPAEYQIPGHVAETVVNDIANWIKKQ